MVWEAVYSVMIATTFIVGIAAVVTRSCARPLTDPAATKPCPAHARPAADPSAI